MNLIVARALLVLHPDMKREVFKIIKRHKEGCSAVKNVENGTWTTPWFFKEFYYFYKWIRVGRVICNSTNCKAELRIDIKKIEEGFNQYIYV